MYNLYEIDENGRDGKTKGILGERTIYITNKWRKKFDVLCS